MYTIVDKIKFLSSGSRRNRDHQPKHPLASLTIACALTKPTTATMTIDDKAATPITYHDVPPGQANVLTSPHALEAIAHGTSHAVLAEYESDRGIHPLSSTPTQRTNSESIIRSSLINYEFMKCISSGQCHNIVGAG